MPHLAVTAEEHELVARGAVILASRVQVVNPALESLPLCLLTLGVEALVGRVVPLQEAKVDLGLSAGPLSVFARCQHSIMNPMYAGTHVVEATGVGRGFILQEVATDGAEGSALRTVPKGHQ